MNFLPTKTGAFYRIARKQLDVHEVSGASANEEIIKYLKSTSLSSTFNSTDETPWCSAFVNWCVEMSGVEGTKRADAVSWLEWGVPADTAVRGTIVVFKWANGGHHVGFVSVFDQDGKVAVLGGNQSNQVKISEYDKKYVIGYRNPTANYFPRITKLITAGVGAIAAAIGIITLVTKLSK